MSERGHPSEPPITTPTVSRVGRNMNCRLCSRSLRGLRFDQACPGCGTRVAESLELSDAAAGTTPRAQADSFCIGCDYNLFGISEEGRCPECGLPVTQSGEVDDALSLMPMRIIRHVAGGCWAMIGCIAVLVGLIPITTVLEMDQAEFLTALAIISCLWFGATWLITPAFTIKQAEFHGFTSRSRLRTAARVGQLGWIAAAGGALVLEVLPNAPRPLTVLMHLFLWGGLIVGVAGLWVLLIVLQELAEWARDRWAETLLNWTVWGIGVGLLLLMVWRMLLKINILLLAIGAMELIASVAMVLALASLARSTTLSLLHAKEHQWRTQRRYDRKTEDAQKVARTVKIMDRPKEE